MRFIDILNEKPVESSWITNITYNRPKKIIAMGLSNGRLYHVIGPSRTTFEAWYKSASKGRFFHDQIAGRYDITRTR